MLLLFVCSAHTRGTEGTTHPWVPSGTRLAHCAHTTIRTDYIGFSPLLSTHSGYERRTETHQDGKELVQVAHGAVRALRQELAVLNVQVQLIVELVAVVDLVWGSASGGVEGQGHKEGTQSIGDEVQLAIGLVAAVDLVRRG